MIRKKIHNPIHCDVYMEETYGSIIISAIDINIDCVAIDKSVIPDVIRFLFKVWDNET